MSRYATAYTDAKPHPGTASGLHFAAMRVALRYAHRTPAWRELVDAFGMSRATACRWVRAMKDAKGEA